ncbi:CidA/LrgA family protein [Fulvimarina sp. 2208YS6-2-32]|uniref:CidA/LrgA family protein n=1 Tax=Fulvimarina uroteuthidis TaxID=3098149 RepID=A0ABU5I3Y3_9HYPH|nr:CidA/LrgA family protein [Fulvimarina sp. 2208YS6-2-32]MDY8109668.1 CidA/LrgA family protein [Fulvimarina sp. 2208YS6-2-32]
MLRALTAIFACQLVGEALVAASGLPMPGPVIGMALLFGFFVARGGIPAPIASVGDGLLGNLSVLFVPAGVGIMQHAARISSEGVQLGGALVGSTLVTIGVTGLVMKFFMKPDGRAKRKRTDHG